MGNVGRHAAHGAMWTVAVALLLIGMFVLLVHPRVFITNTYMDVNSGDVRVRRTFCGLRIWNSVRTTRFSREVRRLDVAAAGDPVWRPVISEYGLLMGEHDGYRLGRVIGLLEYVAQMFAHGEVPDSQRVVILQEILRGLRKPGPGPEIYEQFRALEDKVYGTN